MAHLFYLVLIILLGGVLGFLYWKEKQKAERSDSDLQKGFAQFAEYKKRTDHLRQYEVIDDANWEAQRIVREAEIRRDSVDQECRQLIETAKAKSDEDLKDARAQAREARKKADEVLAQAHEIAARISKDARKRAEEIAGEAWEAKQNADQYSATVRAMKHIIKGYGDEYLIPNESVLDELAADFDHKEAGRELAKIRAQIRSMIKGGEAADCDYVEQLRKTTAIEFVLDAFNGKIDSIMAKVKHDNYGKLLQQIEDAYRIVNHNGRPFKDARITGRYYQVMIEQLKLAVAAQTLRQQELEEQRRIREAMREEERARREYEKAIKQAEKEERLLQQAMKEAEARLASAAQEERAKYKAQLEELAVKLKEAEEKEQRAISMAEQTRRGHVYVISNAGSFGDDVFKIGLTRRLEPLDRIKELGDASVPFPFDVHAMIHAEDAPALEAELHRSFPEQHVNKVNPRKEFFRVSLGEIRQIVDGMGLEAHWTMKAEALEYRETLQLERRESGGRDESIAARAET